jgi:ATP adenylyltransferase
MDRIWSPWRYQFITEGAAQSGCIFCELQKNPEDDEKHFILFRGAGNYILLNIFPYTAGHMMIVPYEHVDSLAGAKEETSAEMMRLTRLAERALHSVYHPQGMNLGMNLGAAAGAGIAQHIHMHILPRWTGDANFLTTIGETRMLPEELPVTWRKLKSSFAELTA